MNIYKKIQLTLEKLADPIRAHDSKRFFKVTPGAYAEHEQFIGITVPVLRKVCKEFSTTPIAELQLLLESPINEERMLGLFVLVDQYNKATHEEKEKIYQFYLKNTKHINNWNLVDASAHLIVGNHLLNTNKEILITLSKSDYMWERRIAIVSTWFFIRNDQYEWTVKLSEILLNDPHDLIHKSVGWMLREMGKRDLKVLVEFLDQYATQMPRTMLRYAIEKFPESARKLYLMKR
ncbi:MAG: DNA alkylation repair protein [Alphaproteobacteria bacterium]|nr:DNA alkylation repair protein [Alphaproteobacteria bacterium]